MKVIARRLRDLAGAEAVDSAWMTLGREYVVLALYADLERGDRVQVLVITNHGGRIVAWFDLVDFEVTDPRPSRCWVITGDGKDRLGLEPATWTDPLFWPVFFDDVPDVRVAGDPGPIPDATERFDVAVRDMLSEAGVPWENDPATV